MSEDQEDRGLSQRQQQIISTPVVRGQSGRNIPLGQQSAIDLSSLSPPEAETLEVEAAKRALERDHRTQMLHTDLQATRAQLHTFTEAANASAQQNVSFTATNTKEDSLGTTQIIIGNTEAARSGKLSRAQQGLPDTAKVWIIVAAIVGAVIVLVAALGR